MPTYKDKEFCEASNRTCYNEKCDRFFSHKDLEDARKWWGDREFPVLFRDMSKGCKEKTKQLK